MRSPGKAKREPRDVIFRKSGLIGNVCFSLVLIGSGAHAGGRRAPKDDQEELGWYLWGKTLRKREHRMRKNTDVYFCIDGFLPSFFAVFHILAFIRIPYVILTISRFWVQKRWFVGPPWAPNLEAKIDQKSIKNRRRFWHRFFDDFLGFWVHFGLHLGLLFEPFLVLFSSEGPLGAKSAIFTKTHVFTWFLMILRVSGDQNVIIVGLGGGFFDVPK